MDTRSSAIRGSPAATRPPAATQRPAATHAPVKSGPAKARLEGRARLSPSVRRASPAAQAGRVRAADVALRLGRGLLEARRCAGLTQAELAARAGISQSRISELERGRGAAASIETWAVLAAVVGEQLAAFLERTPGASQPRDSAHLRRQELVLRMARGGGWSGQPEAPVLAGDRPRSIDLLLLRRERREAVVVETWDLLDHVGSALRGTDAKARAVAERKPGWRVGCLWVVRGTRRNPALVRQFPELLRARFPVTGDAWPETLADPGRPMPGGAGLVLTDVSGERLLSARRLRPNQWPGRP